MPTSDGKTAKGPRVAVIGGGGTGAAILHDLALRGFSAALFERGELTSGTTGRHHGQLHSGARYAVGDAGIARECMRENAVLRRIAPQALEFNEGLFVALTPDDEEYCGPFLAGCEVSGIPASLLTARQAVALEPNLNPSIKLAVRVPDGTIDAYRLPLHFFASAKRAGAAVNIFAEIVGLEKKAGIVSGIRVRDRAKRCEYVFSADLVINATGPWAGSTAALAGAALPVTPSPGVMVAVKGRLADTVISRLHPPGDGDTVVPQRNLSIIGTTGTLTEDPDRLETAPEDVRFLLARADALIPSFSKAPIQAVWAAARPLVGEKGWGSGEHPDSCGADHVPSGDPRSLSRDFVVYDHLERDGLGGLISVTGGKATVLRAMAEAVVDRVCERFGVEAPCTTAATPLANYRCFFR